MNKKMLLIIGVFCMLFLIAAVPSISAADAYDLNGYVRYRDNLKSGVTVKVTNLNTTGVANTTTNTTGGYSVDLATLTGANWSAGNVIKVKATYGSNSDNETFTIANETEKTINLSIKSSGGSHGDVAPARTDDTGQIGLAVIALAAVACLLIFGLVYALFSSSRRYYPPQQTYGGKRTAYNQTQKKPPRKTKW